MFPRKRHPARHLGDFCALVAKQVHRESFRRHKNVVVHSEFGPTKTLLAVADADISDSQPVNEQNPLVRARMSGQAHN
jgi:hypothetical protein